METAQLSLAEEAYNKLRHEILTCALVPGTLVTRAYLADCYQAGHAAVRDALSRLAQEDLVQVLPREGYLIAPITFKQVQDVLDARLLVEPRVARLAAGQVDSERLRRLHDLCGAPQRFEDVQTLGRFIEANAAFHLAVAEGTGNDRLVSIVKGLLESMGRFMYASYLLRERPSTMAEVPDSFVEAMVTGDKDEAERLMQEDIKLASEFVLAALMSSKAVQSVNVFDAAGT
ncbi:MAG TPA: GntR family transcriptional regulator [Chloroflexia bacterium]|nr:GntR family transcriptional regulator [Chloroflexia bacterium]